jgi:poly-gamma-glutamate synthesis protein (capsule biosynthesis protein)
MPYCSRDFYLEVFRHLGINIIEMTGSHLMTHGARWFEHSLKLFKNHSMQWYGGGSTRGKASAPLLLNKNANKIALLGCNARPPEETVAQGRKPGISECNEDALLHQIKKLKSEGYAVIITVKSPGKAVSKPPRLQKAMFRKLSSSGADAVVGTQGSQPRAMEFYKGGFIHYGLGNFLYDGMESVDIRHQVYDRLIFYGGRLLSIELETAILEEHGRPRATTKKERKSFLKKLFKVRF